MVNVQARAQNVFDDELNRLEEEVEVLICRLRENGMDRDEVVLRIQAIQQKMAEIDSQIVDEDEDGDAQDEDDVAEDRSEQTVVVNVVQNESAELARQKLDTPHQPIDVDAVVEVYIPPELSSKSNICLGRYDLPSQAIQSNQEILAQKFQQQHIDLDEYMTDVKSGLPHTPIGNRNHLLSASGRSAADTEVHFRSSHFDESQSPSSSFSDSRPMTASRPPTRGSVSLLGHSSPASRASSALPLPRSDSSSASIPDSSYTPWSRIPAAERRGSAASFTSRLSSTPTVLFPGSVPETQSDEQLPSPSHKSSSFSVLHVGSKTPPTYPQQRQPSQSVAKPEEGIVFPNSPPTRAPSSLNNSSPCSPLLLPASLDGETSPLGGSEALSTSGTFRKPATAGRRSTQGLNDSRPPSSCGSARSFMSQESCRSDLSRTSITSPSKPPLPESQSRRRYLHQGDGDGSSDLVRTPSYSRPTTRSGRLSTSTSRASSFDIFEDDQPASDPVFDDVPNILAKTPSTHDVHQAQFGRRGASSSAGQDTPKTSPSTADVVSPVVDSVFEPTPPKAPAERKVGGFNRRRSVVDETNVPFSLGGTL